MDPTEEPFFLPPPSKRENQLALKVHPLVVFNILDHYRRREDSQHRVIGTLLGEVVETSDGKEIHIKNCYPVPHKDFPGNENKVSVEIEYHKSMAALQKRLHPKEEVVGWYSTSLDITYTTSLIHDVLTRHSKEPIHLVVDATLSGHKLSVLGYVGRSLRVEGKDIISQFEKVKTEYVSTEPAKIAVDAMINVVPAEPTKGEGDEMNSKFSPATMLTEMESLEGSLDSLLELLEIVSEYVDRVNKGDEKSTPEVRAAVKDAMAAIPRVDLDMFTRMFNQKTENLLMILYLTNIVRAQVALGNRIYEVLE
mmetsp:Transcript_32695/g.79506  ORF Transcript_32695/g.79506 Transcript_32695/m.79506 type:complete len:309 (-) Transcript_32695:403-1329(-)|eukprot:CAMPEP_0114522564 /NCGR_PEP_ID=MMETSP0109-20121206/20804_1 /TAXON_ID=29199 /ORGANISM="Chlorarachnion reptans, Strain CCCM449" /LENGTH=308 /DNA_ID=CAMNT_0001703779 /DNA_START=73 /DNA_END=999 /DNA_ORIENTATION=+